MQLNDKKSNIIVITARAGSEGVIGKNFKDFYGKPLIYWSIKNAVRTSIWHRDLKIYVSTNCNYVKQVCIKHFPLNLEDGSIEIIDRPEEISGPKSKNEEALKHASDFYFKKNGYYPNIIFNLQPTSPIRRNGIINDVINIMEEYVECDSVFSTVKEKPFLWRMDSFEKLTPQYDFNDRKMRQDLLNTELFYKDCGSIYAVKSDVLYSKNNRIGEYPKMIVLDEIEAMQIDSEDDFGLMEYVLSKKINCEKYKWMNVD